LDKGTSGATVIALNPKSASELSDKFRKRKVKKEYLAFTHGLPYSEENGFSLQGSIETGLLFDHKEKK
jgi:23S rRNA-/tRNA-specific pseudouridylate synthase